MYDENTGLPIRCTNCTEDYAFKATSLIYNDWGSSNYCTGRVDFSNIPYNSSIGAKMVYLEHGKDISQVDLTQDQPPQIITLTHPLTSVRKLKVINKQNLLSQEDVVVVSEEPKYLNHWKGNLTASILQDMSPISLQGTKDELVFQHYRVLDRKRYLPPVIANDFWIFKDETLPLNETSQNISLDITYEPLSLMKFTYYVHMEQSLDTQLSLLGETEGNADDIKRIFIDNPPWLLALTFVISILHTIFDVLAFKSEIQFWKSRKTMEGLSLKTIYINLISNFIILLYLIDNDASWMVLISGFLGTIIEGWKVTKATHVSIRRWIGFIPIPQFKEKASYKSTKKYDDEAMKYLYYSLYPIVLGYSIYSLIYETHKSWYSWIVSSLAGCVYVFGFIMLTPQLFINYRMKSVSHLPWRTFVYKAFNTFIDDFFAFIIRMPTMHRLRCLRDDIIFFIYLYQRWIYPVDKSRVESVGGDLGESIDLDAWEDLEKLAELKEGQNPSENTQEELSTVEEIKDTQEELSTVAEIKEKVD